VNLSSFPQSKLDKISVKPILFFVKETEGLVATVNGQGQFIRSGSITPANTADDIYLLSVFIVADKSLKRGVVFRQVLQKPRSENSVQL